MKKIIALLMFLMCAFAVNAQKPKKAESEKTQCVAITTKGNRCKLEVVEGFKYCSVHIGQDAKVNKCKATTRNGNQCSRAASKNGYCTQHYKLSKKK